MWQDYFRDAYTGFFQDDWRDHSALMLLKNLEMGVRVLIVRKAAEVVRARLRSFFCYPGQERRKSHSRDKVLAIIVTV